MSDLNKPLGKENVEEGCDIISCYDSLFDLVVLNSSGYNFEVKVGKKLKILSAYDLLQKKYYKEEMGKASRFLSNARITELLDIEVYNESAKTWDIFKEISLMLR